MILQASNVNFLIKMHKLIDWMFLQEIELRIRR